MKTMEAKTKRNLIIWGIVFLVMINISSLGTIWYHRYQFKHDRMNKSSREKMMDKRSQKMFRRGPVVLTRGLDLSELQRQEFDSIWKYYNKIRISVEERMEDNRKKMGAIMSKEKIDTSSFYAMSASQSRLMLELDHSMVNMNLALRSILNNEQIEVFLNRIEMLNKRRSIGHPGEARMRKRIK